MYGSVGHFFPQQGIFLVFPSSMHNSLRSPFFLDVEIIGTKEQKAPFISVQILTHSHSKHTYTFVCHLLLCQDDTIVKSALYMNVSGSRAERERIIMIVNRNARTINLLSNTCMETSSIQLQTLKGSCLQTSQIALVLCQHVCCGWREEEQHLKFMLLMVDLPSLFAKKLIFLPAYGLLSSFLYLPQEYFLMAKSSNCRSKKFPVKDLYSQLLIIITKYTYIYPLATHCFCDVLFAYVFGIVSIISQNCLSASLYQSFLVHQGSDLFRNNSP